MKDILCVLKKDIAIVKVSIVNEMAYKLNFIIKMLYELIPVISAMCLWNFIYADSVNQIGQYNKINMFSYYVVAFISASFLNVGLDEFLYVNEIKSGLFVKYLLKPYKTSRYLFFESCKSVYVFVRYSAIPIMFFLLAFGNYICIDYDLVKLIIWLISIVLGYFINFFMKKLVISLAFFIDNVSCLPKAINMFKKLIGGNLIPIDLMPVVIYRSLCFTPFQFLGYYQTSLLVSEITQSYIVEGLCLEISWLIILNILSNYVWNKGLKKYSTFGG